MGPSAKFLGTDDEWKVRAKCRGCDPELFFPERRRASRRNDPARDLRLRVREAQSVCEDCPVRSQCYSMAIDSKVRDGVWGGVFFGNGHVRQRVS